MPRPPPRSTLFPYTTLFRSWSSRSAQFTYGQLREIRGRQEAFKDVIAWSATRFNLANAGEARYAEGLFVTGDFFQLRSEEHTSELQSLRHLVCRLLLEKKNK